MHWVQLQMRKENSLYHWLLEIVYVGDRGSDWLTMSCLSSHVVWIIQLSAEYLTENVDLALLTIVTTPT